jgi:DNA-binding CsgD family transcriptional regulator
LTQKRCSASVSLTARQLQVLQLAVDGLSAKEIAQELSISVRTAEGHLAALRSLAGVGTLHGLTAWAVASGAAWPSWLSIHGLREAVAREPLAAFQLASRHFRDQQTQNSLPSGSAITT